MARTKVLPGMSVRATPQAIGTANTVERIITSNA